MFGKFRKEVMDKLTEELMKTIVKLRDERI